MRAFPVFLSGSSRRIFGFFYRFLFIVPVRRGGTAVSGGFRTYCGADVFPVCLLFAGFLMKKQAVLLFCCVVFRETQGVDRRIFRKKDGGQMEKSVFPLFCLLFHFVLRG